MKTTSSAVLTSFFFFPLVVCTASTSSAALTVSLTPSRSTVLQDGGTVTLTGTLSGTAGERLQGYDMFIDVTGRDLPNTMFSVSQPARRDFGDALTFNATLAGDDADIAINAGTFGPNVATDGGLDLFEFDVMIGPGFASGEVIEFQFDTSVAQFQINSDIFTAFDLNQVQFEGAQIAVTAIPEPSTMALLAAGCTGIGILRRRFKRV